MRVVERIAFDLNLEANFIKNILRSPKKQYKIYNINKKNGGKRTIYHPTPVMKTLQHWLINNVLNDFHISKHATGYRKGMSIKDNAEVHKESNFILNMDINSFFSSIKKQHLTQILNSNNKYNFIDIYYICQIAFYDDYLPTGSVSSPYISNCIMFKFDTELSEKLPNDFHYTRYADDITLSSKFYIEESVLLLVEQVIENHGLVVNYEKTRFMSNKESQTITGLNVNDGSVTIGTKKKRLLKKKLYNKFQKNIGDSEVILGHLNFLKSIEPDYFNKLIVKYSIYGNVLEMLKDDIKEERINSHFENTQNNIIDYSDIF